MEERGLDYEVETLPFPPRAFQREFLDTNRLGNVPHFMHGDRDMTESTAICLYLVEKYNGEDDEGGWLQSSVGKQTEFSFRARNRCDFVVIGPSSAP